MGKLGGWIKTANTLMGEDKGLKLGLVSRRRRLSTGVKSRVPSFGDSSPIRRIRSMVRERCRGTPAAVTLTKGL